MAIEEEINAQNTENQLEENEPVFKNRSQRRLLLKYQGVLDSMKRMSLKQWMSIVKTNQKEGRKIKNQRDDYNDEQETKRLEEKINNLKDIWREIGYNESEIEKLEEAHSILTIKDKENWQEEKKKARKLMKEAQLSLSNRLKNNN